MFTILFATLHFIVIAIAVKLINNIVQPTVRKLVKKLEQDYSQKLVLQIIAIIILSNLVVILVSAAMLKYYMG